MNRYILLVFVVGMLVSGCSRGGKVERQDFPELPAAVSQENHLQEIVLEPVQEDPLGIPPSPVDEMVKPKPLPINVLMEKHPELFE